MALVADVVSVDAFFTAGNRVVWGAVVELLRQRKPADVVTVFDHLSAAGVGAESYGGLPYLTLLEQAVPNARNARRYAEIIVERAAERALIAAMDEAGRIGWDSASPLADRLDRIGGLLRAVQARHTDPGAARVPLLGLAGLRAASAAIKWTCKGVVPADSVGMMFGGSGTFKSFIALDFALHVAHGLPWMGRITKPGPVVFIAAEGGAGLWLRIDAWHRARGLSWAKVPFYVVPVAVDLQADAWRVVDAVQLLGVTPAVVVVDTLSQTYAGDENSANEMAAYMRELGRRFRALWHCTVLLIHHSGHSATERPRGSSAIRANIDFLLGVFRDEREMLATVECQKQKDGALFDDAKFTLGHWVLGRDEDGDEINSLVARHLSTKEEERAAQDAEAQAGRSGRGSVLMRLAQSGMSEKALRLAFYEQIAGEPDAKKHAYYRARDRAQKDGLIEIAQGVVIVLNGQA